LLRFADENPGLEIYWVVFSSTPQRKLEAEEAARLFLKNVRSQTVNVLTHRDGFLPYVAMEVKEHFEKLKGLFAPDLIFTHYRHDLHQDHRLLCELTWNTFRNHWILEYEVPKYDGDLGSPNLFVNIEESVLRKKIEYLFEAFKSQRVKHWFTPDLFTSLPRLRGIEANSPTRYAEGFYCRKLSI
jgi:LmbE family N-acetylglucosaminyl deacetylase